MEKTIEVLWSLIPLILIIIFSWLFSLMGSKVKNQPQGKAPAPKEGTGSPILDMLLNLDKSKEEVQPGPPVPAKEVPGAQTPLEPGAWNPPSISRPTQVSSEPITPKWWGA
jgi:hypothetical protein